MPDISHNEKQRVFVDGRSRHQCEASFVMRGNRREECVQMLGKWPDQALGHRSGCPRC